MNPSLFLSRFFIPTISPQVSSEAYQYDLCLFKLNRVYQRIARSYQSGYHTHLDGVDPGLFLSCVNASWLTETSIDEIVRSICAHWQSTKILRDIYLDRKVAAEYRVFRARFSASTRSEKANLVKPGFPMAGFRKLGLRKLFLHTSGLGKHIFPPSDNYRSQSKRRSHFGPNFGGRFHRALCLHSIAVVSRQITIAAGGPESEGISLSDMWTKERVRIGGETVSLTKQDKLDCLEVFDFLYLFALRKVVPPKDTESWAVDEVLDFRAIRGDPNPPRPGNEDWFDSTVHLRRCLQPVDVATLISKKVWKSKNKPALDKEVYLKVRGAQDMQRGPFEWRSCFGRWSMLDALKPPGDNVAWFDSKDHGWWDRFRVQSGSPFDPRFELESLNQFQTNEHLPATFNYRRGASFRLTYSEKNCD